MAPAMIKHSIYTIENELRRINERIIDNIKNTYIDISSIHGFGLFAKKTNSGRCHPLRARWPKDGLESLREVKKDNQFRRIPRLYLYGVECAGY